MNMATLVEALRQCSYREDVEALAHFVFHPRYNGASAQCLICFHYIGEDDSGHNARCEYDRARARCADELLSEWLNRQ